jgi:PAS domain S-box-containing protein
MIKENDNIFILNQYLDMLDNKVLISKTNLEGIITFVNDKFVEVSGYSRNELLGSPHSIVRHPDMEKSFFKNLWVTIKDKKETWTGEIRNKKKDGSTYYIEAIIKPICDNNGQVVEFIAIRYDITAYVNQKKLLLDEIAKIQNPFLVMIQIEDYENLETFYGKEITNIIEDKFASHVLDYCPSGCSFDKVFHLDNGIFALIKSIDDIKEGVETFSLQLQKLQQNIKDGVLKFGGYEYDLNVRLSYGYNRDHLYDNILMGLKKAKVLKKDFMFADPFTKLEKETAKKNLHTINIIKKAIEHNEVISFFQPIVDTKTGEIIKYESLVRILMQDGTILSPYDFLEISKNGRYYHQITEAVLENSFKALQKTDKGITINLSTLDIEDDDIRNKIVSLLSINIDRANRVTFELLEDEDVKDFNAVKKFISLVKMLGVTIAIDDFGSGHSNFERLLDFQPDILKIDGSLIKNISNDTFSRNIVETIKLFSDKQKIKTVAEFVSSKETLDIVTEIGIDYLQGYLLAKPTNQLVNNIDDEDLFRR